MYCPRRGTKYEDGDTSDLVLDCGGTVSFTKSFLYLGSLLHYDLSDDHDVDTRIKKASKAFGALRDRFFSSATVPERLKGKIYADGVLSVLLYGCESWCLSAKSLNKLTLWHNKRPRNVQSDHVPDLCSSNLFKKLATTHGGFRPALLGIFLGIPTSRAAHSSGDAQESPPKRLVLSWVG